MCSSEDQIPKMAQETEKKKTSFAQGNLSVCRHRCELCRSESVEDQSHSTHDQAQISDCTWIAQRLCHCHCGRKRRCAVEASFGDCSRKSDSLIKTNSTRFYGILFFFFISFSSSLEKSFFSAHAANVSSPSLQLYDTNDTM